MKLNESTVSFILESLGESDLKCDPYDRREDFNSVYFDGVFYIGTEWYLFAFNIIQGTFKELELSSDTNYEGWKYTHQLVVCKDELPMVVSKEGDSTSPRVLKIDLDGLTLTEWNDGPPSLAVLDSSSRAMAPVGDKDHIFFGYVGHHGSRMRAYNISANLWSSSFAPLAFCANCKYNSIASFQPGFKTFAPV